MRPKITCLIAGMLLSAVIMEISAKPTANPESHVFEMVLRPVTNGQREVEGIVVHQEIHGTPSTDGTPFTLTAPVTYAGVTHVADRIQSLDVQDAKGQISFKIEDDKPAQGGFPYYRHWRAERAVQFPVTVDYEALVQPAGSPNGPPFGIRPSGGGVSGAGCGFLLLPENGGTSLSRVRWDLGSLPKGSIGVTSFGEGDFELSGSPSEVNQGWMLAGPAGQYRSETSSFSAFWLGKPPFDVEAEMSWTAKAYSYLGKSFRYLDPVPTFRVFMRVLDTQPVGGGTALTHSFMLSMGTNGPREGVEHIRGTFFHEMTHQWVGDMQGSVGEAAWYEEGLTVYYSAILPLRGGLESVDDYLNEVNQEARNYYQSPARNWSAAKIAEVGFGDETIRHTPYARGALYFADLDWKIRQASHGKYNLDSFLYPMFVERLKGTALTQQLWENMLSKELGPQGVVDFRGELVDGNKTVVPDSGAFGPCFQRESVGMKTSDGQVVTGYQWSRIAGTPDEKCRVW